MPNRKKTSSDDDEYRNKRQRNNEAVKKSRMKAREKADETKKRVDDLKIKNTVLEAKIDALKNDIKTSKELFIRVASAKPDKLTEEEIKLLQAPDSDDSEGEVFKSKD